MWKKTSMFSYLFSCGWWLFPGMPLPAQTWNISGAVLAEVGLDFLLLYCHNLSRVIYSSL